MRAGTLFRAVGDFRKGQSSRPIHSLGLVHATRHPAVRGRASARGRPIRPRPLLRPWGAADWCGRQAGPRRPLRRETPLQPVTRIQLNPCFCWRARDDSNIRPLRSEGKALECNRLTTFLWRRARRYTGGIPERIVGPFYWRPRDYPGANG